MYTKPRASCLAKKSPYSFYPLPVVPSTATRSMNKARKKKKIKFERLNATTYCCYLETCTQPSVSKDAIKQALYTY